MSPINKIPVKRINLIFHNTTIFKTAVHTKLRKDVNESLSPQRTHSQTKNENMRKMSQIRRNSAFMLLFNTVLIILQFLPAIGRTTCQSSQIEKYSHRGRKYRTLLVATRSKVPNRNFRPQSGQKGKISWRETLRTTGAKFPTKILSPDQNFRILPTWSHPG